MRKFILVCTVLVVMVTMLSACRCEHQWGDASCVAPKTCYLCAQTEGDALGHLWNDATCLDPLRCSVCGTTVGDPIPHSPGEAQTEINLTIAVCSKKQSCTECGTVLSDAETVMSLVKDGAFLLSIDDFVSRLNYIYEQTGRNDWSARIDYLMNGDDPIIRISYRGNDFLRIDFSSKEDDPITHRRITKERQDEPIIEKMLIWIEYWNLVGYNSDNSDNSEEKILAMVELYEDDSFFVNLLSPLYIALDPALTTDEINASILRGRTEREVTATKEFYYNEQCGDLYVEYFDAFNMMFCYNVKIAASEEGMSFPFE